MRACVLMLAVLVPACGVSLEWDEPGLAGSGAVATESRDVPAFSRVEVADDFEVTITVGPATDVSVTGDDNLLSHVRTAVVGETLEIESDRDLSPRGEAIRIAISTPRLAAVSSSGSSDVRVVGVAGERFESRVSGSGGLAAEGAFGDLAASVSGSGRIAMQGTARSVRGTVSGSGGLDLEAVEARTARVRVTGSGSARVNATESLDAEVTGSGHVRYAGSPRVTDRISGSGEVERI